MNNTDMDVALSFIDDWETEETIMFQCFNRNAIPLVKRLLTHTIGQPSSILEFDKWRYGRKTFIFRSMASIRPDEDYGFRGRQFYISLANGSDWEEVHESMREDSNYVAVSPFMLTGSVDIIDVYNMMISEGYSADKAVHVINTHLLVEV